MSDHTPLSVDQQRQAFRDGVYDGFLTAFTTTGGYPMTFQDAMDAFREGAKQAVAEYLAAHPDALRSPDEA